ncbi:MAG: hypothetical protein ACYCZF_09170 [Anaerolineae bacterium]
MKKIVRDAYRHFGPVKVFLNDLEVLVTRLSTEPEIKSVEISTPTTKYDTLEELRQNEPIIIDSVTLTSVSNILPSISVSIGGKFTIIYCLRNSDITATYLDSITTYLQAKQRKFRHYGFKPLVLLIPACIFLIVALVSNLDRTLGYVALALTIIGIIFGLLNSLALAVSRSKIYLCSPSELPNFWKTNKDKLLIEVIKGAVTAAVGSGLTLLVQWLIRIANK